MDQVERLGAHAPLRRQWIAREPVQQEIPQVIRQEKSLRKNDHRRLLPCAGSAWKVTCVSLAFVGKYLVDVTDQTREITARIVGKIYTKTQIINLQLNRSNPLGLQYYTRYLCNSVWAHPHWNPEKGSSSSAKIESMSVCNRKRKEAQKNHE